MKRMRMTGAATAALLATGLGYVALTGLAAGPAAASPDAAS